MRLKRDKACKVLLIVSAQYLTVWRHFVNTGTVVAAVVTIVSFLLVTLPSVPEECCLFPLHQRCLLNSLSLVFCFYLWHLGWMCNRMCTILC